MKGDLLNRISFFIKQRLKKLNFISKYFVFNHTKCGATTNQKKKSKFSLNLVTNSLTFT